KSETEKARELISAGRFPEALRKMERLLRENPDEADAWYLRGEALCRMGRAEEGHRSIARARELSSPKPVRRRSSSRGH
ncbi:MAG: tetratricopeptide repeat protein, partial [Euryarchaeota archaeon]|nr:tetratricopeptide repeat protein [Euryarchaeota archaeon]